MRHQYVSSVCVISMRHQYCAPTRESASIEAIKTRASAYVEAIEYRRYTQATESDIDVGVETLLGEVVHPLLEPNVTLSKEGGNEHNNNNPSSLTYLHSRTRQLQNQRWMGYRQQTERRPATASVVP